MLFSAFVKLSLLPLAAAARASGSARMACFDETLAMHCYDKKLDTPQELNETDVAFIAAALRAYGKETRAGRQLTMLAADTADCGEWSLYTRNTAQVTAKKINMTFDSSVLFEEIANTIDGGTGLIKLNGLYECGVNGGSWGVQVNASAAAYNTPQYLAAKYKPDGIIIKVVANL